MLTVENEYFIRLLLLIFKAGTSVLRQVFMKKLVDSGLHLTDFLLFNKGQIDKLKEDKVLTLIQYNNLYPRNGKVTYLDNYDISLLSCLLLNIFSKTLKASEVKAIEHIRTIRNEFPAHHPNDSIDVKTYHRKWNRLHQSIINLGSELTDEQRLNLEQVVISVGEDRIDIKHAIQDIKGATGNIDQFIEHVSRQLENLSLVVREIRIHQEDTSKKIKDLQLKCENRNTSFIIIGEVTISSENPEAAVRAAKLLIDDAKKCTGSLKNTSTIMDNDRERDTNKFSPFDLASSADAINAESTDTKRIAIDLVKDINDAGGDIEDITEGSVLLHIRCNSVPVVSHVVNYFQSSQIEQRLSEIAKRLTEEVGTCVHLSANIKKESLQEEPCRLLQLVKKQQFSTKARFSIKCQNTNGVLNVVKLMESDDMTTKMIALSNDLSNKVGCSVTLRSSVDKSPLQQYIVEKRGANEDKAETKNSDYKSDVLTTKNVGVQTMRLQNIPKTLEVIVLQLRVDRDIRNELQHTTSEAKDVSYNYRQAMEKEGKDVLKNKSILVETFNPTEVNVKNLKDSLTSLQRALKEVRDDMLVLQANVGNIIEKCRARIREYLQQIQSKEIDISCLKSQIDFLQGQINECEEDAREQENLAIDYKSKAIVLKRKAEEHTKKGFGESLLLLGTGAAVSVATGGLGGVVFLGGAAAGTFAGRINSADKCEEKASEYSQRASERKEEANRHRMYKIIKETEKNSKESEVRHLQIENDNLNDALKKLQESKLEKKLYTAVSVIDNVTLNVQNLDTILFDAEKQGNPFRIIQDAFVRNPEKYEGKAQDYLDKLKAKWLCVEMDLVNA